MMCTEFCPAILASPLRGILILFALASLGDSG